MNILVIRTHRFGDILQLTPMLRGLKEGYPESAVYFMVGKDFVPLLEGNPDADAIIPIPEKKYRYLLKDKPERYSRIFNELYDIVLELRKIKFDLIINRQYEWGAIFAYLIGADKILGGSYSPEKGFYFSDQPSKELFDLIRNKRKDNRMNLADWACRISGVPSGGYRQAYFYVTQWAREEAGRLLGDNEAAEGRSLVGVQMGAAKSFRQWGVNNFIQIVNWLINEKQKRVVLIGSEDERELFTRIEQALDEAKDNLISLIGKTSLKTTGAVLEKCEMLITGDTGPMHMAAAVGTPVLALFFGTAYPWETGPYGPGHFILYSDLPCAPCFDPAPCKQGHHCKKEIKPDVVIKAFEAAEAFWNNEPVHWEPGSNRAKLFVTAQGEEGEQILIPVDDEENFPKRSAQRIWRERHMSHPAPEVLLKKGDEVIRLFLSGEADQGFLSFALYLDYWLETKDVIMAEHPGMAEGFSELLKECLGAMQNKDLVSLIDAIEYGFKPLLERSLILSRNIRISGGDSQGFSAQELPR